MFTVRVDGATAPAVAHRSNLLGLWPFQVGDRVATLRRVRTIDVARNELWVDGVRVPHSAEPIRWKKAAPGLSCEAHRGVAPPAEISCGVCGSALCAGCTAVDGVRCGDCFRDAVERLRQDDRRKQVFGLVGTIALITTVTFVGLTVQSDKVLECAAGMTVLLVFLLVNGVVRGRMEAASVPVPTPSRSVRR
jgi:hypothetical protein